MTTAMQEIKYGYTDGEVQFIVDHEQERKTNEQVTSNINQDEFQKSPKMKRENYRVNIFCSFLT